ncbi:helix-turn-helix domain-containing protein [Luteipulveratus mongoliensis]|uniref:AraC family transcriptional regulator n=1 Tax=Luteipulveratus mongoliensis TaxID=571913 RepID=A0A0K1JJJ1_9MICO|nr:helix-turn-helix domain-containing protein [Luteipulveratus mongoliensis]AKU16876.1 AraC family transcriptional regulator [Luteipulveratus mongoliensis]
MTTYSAVVTTGIYCRPGCGAKPLAENVRTFELAAAAEAAGFRACLRCRPYRVAGPVGADPPALVCQAVQLIIEGVLDDGGTEAMLSQRLAVSSRHLRRMFHEHLGVTPDQLARSRRAHFARRLLDDSDLTVADVAFAAGFGSLRQFNREMRQVFRASPTEMRRRRRRTDRLATDGGLAMRLPFQRPLDWDGVLALLDTWSVPGVESVDHRTYRRTISLDGAPGVLEVSEGGEDYLLLRAHLPFWEGLIHVVERAARIVGADVDPSVVVSPVPGVISGPGLRIPGVWGGFEVAVGSVLRDHLPTSEARDLAGAIVGAHGQPVSGLEHGLTHLFPSAEILARADLGAVGLPALAAEAVHGVAEAVASGEVTLDPGTSYDALRALASLPGVGSGAIELIALRLGHRVSSPGTQAQPVSAAG